VGDYREHWFPAGVAVAWVDGPAWLSWVTWPPRLRLPPPACAALAATAERWSLANLTDGRSQHRALGQLCVEIPSLGDVLGAAAHALRRECAVVVEAVPTVDSALVILASAMGVVSTEDNGSPPRLVWDVRPSPEPSSVRSQRPDAFPLHTDSAHLYRPHAVVGLACVQPSRDRDGLSLLVTADRVRKILQAEGHERKVRRLQEPCFPFASVSESGRPVILRPILGAATDPVQVRYREPLLRWGLQLSPRSLDTAHRSAFQVLDAVLRRASLPTRLLLAANDFLLFDNRRLLHGRTALGLDSERHLKRLKIHEPLIDGLRRATEITANRRT